MSAITVRGLDDVRRKLLSLSPKLAERVQRLALRQGANYMLKAVRAAAPVKTGRLRKAILVRNSKIHRLNKDGVVGVYLAINQGKSRQDKRGAWYGKFVENGYNKGSKQVTGSQAARLGLLTFAEYRQKRAALRGKRRGRYAQGVRVRHGGTHVAGQYFVRDTYNATKEQAAQLIVNASRAVVDRLVKEI